MLLRFFALLLVSTFSLGALELGDDLEVQFFGTLDATYIDNENVQIPAIIPSKARFKADTLDFRNSLVGVQVDLDLTSDISLTLQTLATEFFESDYRGILEWAYASFDLGSDLFLRAGKFKIPYLVGNQLRYVGYARLWVRPIVPIDGVGGYDDYVGGELLYKTYTHDIAIELQLSAGRAEHQNSAIENDFMTILNSRFEYDQTWLSFSLLHAQYDVYTTEALLSQSNATMTMASIEAKTTLDAWVLYAGYSHGAAQKLPTEDFAYASIGYTYGIVTPYTAYTTRAFTQTLEDKTQVSTKREIYSLGVRMDMWYQTAMKFQWDFQTSSAPQTQEEAANYDANVLTFTLDAVF